MLLERSLDIVLSEQPPEPVSAEAVIVPISSTESRVASYGLAKQIEILYRGVLKASNPDRALLSVYELIDADIDKYRERVMNLAVTLDPNRARLASRSPAALAIAYLVVGQQSHRSGEWREGEAREDQLTTVFHEVMASDELTFYELNEWAIKQTARNDRFWRQQLQAVRTHPRINQLREAIETADHQAEV